jgi:hypothetical protein
MGLPELAGPITSKTKFGSRRRAVWHAAPAHAGYTIALRRPAALLGHERNGQPLPFTWKGPQQNHRRRQARAPNVRFDPLARLI